jgi:hypothetical protein
MARSSLLQPKVAREPYRDPIFGIPHYHDPALNRLISKSTPSSVLDESIRLLDRSSTRHLRTLQAHRPRVLHRRFNICTLQNSPLMCFPHFEEMAAFLARWFESRELRKQAAITTTQQATFEAQEQFCRGLFILLQEATRGAPVSPKPLRYIYRWYLQKDLIINQARAVERASSDDAFFVIELADGETIKISKGLIDSHRMFDTEMFESEAISRQLREISVDPVPEEEEIVEEVVNTHRAVIVTETFPGRVAKRAPMIVRPGIHNFDYDSLHEELEAVRRDEQSTAQVACEAKLRRRSEILIHEGWT